MIINKTYDNQIEINNANFGFESYMRMFKIYPENSHSNTRFLLVDIEHRVDKKNRAFDVAKSEIKLDYNRTLFQRENHIKTTKKEFLDESIRLVEKYDGWEAYRNKGRYVNNVAYLTIHFSYHTEYFVDKSNFIINPEIRPKIKNQNDKYERIINNKYGCDGIINVLGVIETTGELTNIEIVGHGGRISGPFAIEQLKSLEDWEPAIHEQRKVRTQIDLLIHI